MVTYVQLNNMIIELGAKVWELLYPHMVNGKTTSNIDKRKNKTTEYINKKQISQKV